MSGTRTLRLTGAAELDHLDPACAYGPPAAQLLRLFTRQLFTYRPEPDLADWRSRAPVPDLALDVPSTYNAGVGASHRSYVVHLRRGVFWDTTPERELTAHDVVRGFKRLANPVWRTPALVYFTSTIRGMARYCADFAAAVPAGRPEPARLAEFQASHDIPGIMALDDETLVFELVRPAIDFVDILALSCASPAPAEYDAYVPDGPELRGNLRSIGPYRLVEHVPGRRLRLAPNPAWRAGTDPWRRRDLDAIEVSVEAATPARVTERIRAGAADLPWGAAASGPQDPPLTPGAVAAALDPCLVFNLRSPVAGGALANAEVRRAIAVALDRLRLAAVLAELDPGTLAVPATGIVPPGNDAHRPGWREPADRAVGNPELARLLLARAGVAGLSLTAVHPDDEQGTRVAAAYAADLERAGIGVRLVGLREFAAMVRDPARGAAGEWDVAAVSCSARWVHHNGRAFLQPMAQSAPHRGTGDIGGYGNPDCDKLVERALEAVVPDHAAAVWQELEDTVLRDAAVVPLVWRTPTTAGPRSARVRRATAMPCLDYAVDLTTVELGTDR